MNKPRADGLDLENLETTVRSEGFARIQRRLQQMIVSLSNEVESADTWEKCIRIQAELKALRRVLALPTILADEIRATKE